MKKILLATVALAALAAPAAAADLAARPTYTKAPVLAPVMTWTGFYIGAMGGYANEDADFAAMKGGFAGGTIGYNWQQGAVVFGLEADAAWADISASATALGVTANSKIRDWGTVRGRLGYAFGPTLLYVTGGYAWADNRITLSAPGISLSDSKIHSGWTVGAGAEWMFAPQWSLKGEYLYKSFGGESYTFTGLGTLATGTLNVHSGQVGINYHF
ncbi:MULTISPECIES: outer membrane protein [Bradyrhizobium]|uniref:Porin family protein n=1 Tax=Bradyrhizobium aeschynomenes TaxID=2734909 RepID=A0ABX2C6D7_9BRAD|nr:MULTISPECIES: outer membrane protein [Bradyrhizobium]NPU12932.1 porin family protein [Bradyrhizobium aeschynomenes]NPU63843.1 porin family protein [Bradyrhizobium aeschynomenes]NPV23255.1 porin family protein [Bradyrhizobium aeschynomenes]